MNKKLHPLVDGVFGHGEEVTYLSYAAIRFLLFKMNEV
jgi:hypothetical protein